MVEIEGADQENPGALSIGKSASVKTAKIHFVDGDVDVALNILTPAAKLGKQDSSALYLIFRNAAKYTNIYHEKEQSLKST